MGKGSKLVHVRRAGVPVLALAVFALLAALPAAAATSPNAYTVTALVSDNAVPGTTWTPTS